MASIFHRPVRSIESYNRPSSNYREQKADSTAFTTWLGRAANICGYKQAHMNLLSKPGCESSDVFDSKVVGPLEKTVKIIMSFPTFGHNRDNIVVSSPNL